LIFRNYFHNATWSGIVAFFRAFSGILCTLLALRLLGTYQYGRVSMWLSFFIIYLSFISSVFTVLVVKLLSTTIEGNTQADPESFRRPATLLCCLSLVFLVPVTLVLSVYSEQSSSVRLLQTQVFDYAILIIGALTGIQILVAFQSAIIEGAGRLDLATKYQLAGPFILLACLLYSYFWVVSFDLVNYLLLICAASVSDLVLISIVRRYLGLGLYSKAKIKASNFSETKKLLRSGGLLQATSLLGLFLEPLNKLLLNHFTGSGNVAIYDLSMKVVWGIQYLISSAMRVFVHIGSQDRPALGKLFAGAVNLLGVPVIVLHSLGAIFLYLVSVYWISIDIVPLMTFFVIATLSNLGMIFISPLYLSLIGANDFSFIFRIQAVLALVNTLVSILAIPFLGLIGAALGLLLATAINVQAIFKRCRNHGVNYSDLVNLISNNKARFFLAIFLFGITIFLVIAETGHIIFLPLAILFFMGIMFREPLPRRMIGYLFNRR